MWGDDDGREIIEEQIRHQEEVNREEDRKQKGE